MSETTEATKETSNTSANSAPAQSAPETGAEDVRTKVTSTINTLVDRGVALAAVGLGYLRLAVENGARALERTAKALETYQERLKKDEPKPAA